MESQNWWSSVPRISSKNANVTEFTRDHRNELYGLDIL